MNLDPQSIEALLALGDDNPEAVKLRRQQAMIDRMRSNAMAPVQTQMTGRIASPNWGQIGSNMLQFRAAEKMQPGVDAANTQMGQRANAARRQYIDALMMANRRQYPDQGTVLPPDGMEDR